MTHFIVLNLACNRSNVTSSDYHESHQERGLDFQKLAVTFKVKYL